MHLFVQENLPNTDGLGYGLPLTSDLSTRFALKAYYVGFLICLSKSTDKNYFI